MSIELDRQVLEAQAAISRYGAKVTKLSFNTGEPQYANVRQVDVEACDQIDGTTKWAVRWFGRVVSQRGSIRYEDSPSSRSRWFLKTYRFDNQDEALRVAAILARELRKWVPNRTMPPERIRLPWRAHRSPWPEPVREWYRAAEEQAANFKREYQGEWL